jgi:hypothetical protein
MSQDLFHNAFCTGDEQGTERVTINRGSAPSTATRKCHKQEGYLVSYTDSQYG